MKFLSFFYFWGHLCSPGSEYGSGSIDPIESGSNSDPHLQPCLECVFTSKGRYGYNILTRVKTTIINSALYLESGLFGGAGYGACTFPHCCGPRTNPRAGPLLGTQRHFVNNYLNFYYGLMLHKNGIQFCSVISTYIVPFV
jgi:hypothetical protein